MTLYLIVLFLHIVGALGMFAAFALEVISLARLRRASTSERAREWLGVYSGVQRLGPASLVLVLLSGLYMVATSWGWVGWIIAALLGLVLIAVVGAILTGLRMAPIGRGVAAESGPLSPALLQRVGDPLLWTSVQIRMAIALGIVFLMTAKLDLTGSLVTLGIAVLVGLVSALPNWRRARTKGEAAASRS